MPLPQSRFPVRKLRQPAPLRAAELEREGRPTRFDLEPAIGFVVAGLLSAGLWIVIGMLVWIF